MWFRLVIFSDNHSTQPIQAPPMVSFHHSRVYMVNKKLCEKVDKLTLASDDSEHAQWQNNHKDTRIQEASSIYPDKPRGTKRHFTGIAVNLKPIHNISYYYVTLIGPIVLAITLQDLILKENHLAKAGKETHCMGRA